MVTPPNLPEWLIQDTPESRFRIVFRVIPNPFAEPISMPSRGIIGPFIPNRIVSSFTIESRAPRQPEVYLQ